MDIVAMLQGNRNYLKSVTYFGEKMEGDDLTEWLELYNLQEVLGSCERVSFDYYVNVVIG